MQINALDYLQMAQAANKVCYFDIEAGGLTADYGSVLTVSILPHLDKKPVSFTVQQAGRDRKVVREACDYLSEFNIWVSYYGKMYDVPMLQTRLLRHNLPRLEKRHHLDMYFLLRSLKTGRRSQAHFLRWLELDEQKMGVSPETWNLIQTGDAEGIKAKKIMIERCESDCTGLRALTMRTQHLVQNITL